MTKIDSFGLEHRNRCRRPVWAVRSNPHGRYQECTNCGIEWRHGDPAGKPRPAEGWTTTPEKNRGEPVVVDGGSLRWTTTTERTPRHVASTHSHL